MPTIDKNVPLPSRSSGTFSGVLATLKGMAAGDSFKVPPEWDVSSLRAQAYSLRGAKFAIHKDGEGYRCWRKS